VLVSRQSKTNLSENFVPLSDELATQTPGQPKKI
jgi:hypothetical protein